MQPDCFEQPVLGFDPVARSCARSSREGGLAKESSRQLLALLIHQQLFTFTRIPISQWKSIRTSNGIELHEEFKQRIKTQTVLPSAERPIKTRQSRSSSATRFPDRIGFWQGQAPGTQAGRIAQLLRSFLHGRSGAGFGANPCAGPCRCSTSANRRGTRPISALCSLRVRICRNRAPSWRQAPDRRAR